MNKNENTKENNNASRQILNENVNFTLNPSNTKPFDINKMIGKPSNEQPKGEEVKK